MKNKIKIAFLIPMTSKGTNWGRIEDSYFYQIFWRSLKSSLNSKFSYRFYLVIDRDDSLFFNEDFKNFTESDLNFNSLIIKIINYSVEKGYLTKLWNIAFKKAYLDGCHYFYQCGDDIEFFNNNWIQESIYKLNLNNGIGLTGPLDLRRFNLGKDYQPGGENFLQTQSFVSRKHMDIFGYFFPEEIRNWFCDDWITKTYLPNYFYPIEHYIDRSLGQPRYEISGSLEIDDPFKLKCNDLIIEGKRKLNKYQNI